jgi:hypothetical protein
MVYIEPGTSAYVEGYGTLSVYNSEEEAVGAGGNLLIPTENLDTPYWTAGSSSGSVRALENYAAGIRVVSGRSPGVTDDYLQYEGYSEAYHDVTGLPGAVPLIPLAVYYLIVALMVIIAAVYISCAIIAASTVNTSEATVDPQTGDTIYRSCIGTPIGGTTCVYYNATTGKTSSAGGTGGLNDALTMIVIGAVAIGGIYIAAKVLPGMMNKNGSRRSVLG